MELASLAQLERSHRRHDEVMASLLEAARRLAAGRPDDGDLDRVREAIAYFERAVTRHFLDEEGSVFPRLSTRRPELAPELASLSAEHPSQIAMQSVVAAAAANLDGESRPGAGKELLDAAMRLAEAHQAHVGREDALFAIAQEALTAEDDAEIVSEMETRRDRDSEDNGRMRGGGGGGRRRGEPVELTMPSTPADTTVDLRPVARRVAKPKARLAKRPVKKPANSRAAKTASKRAAKPAKKPPAKKPPAKKPAKKR